MACNDIRMPEPRVYSHQDLYPGKWDPRCSSQFPLGNFWPVYVGNFWCEMYLEHATKVQEYFASKGLLVRMVFGRRATDDPHFKHQRCYHLYDFLVYFVRQQDAEDAVSYCHREMYYGHRLNVFPGRMPLYFDLTRSVKHVIQQPRKLPMTEQVYETYIRKQCHAARVACVVQHQSRSLLVEYASVPDRDRAIRYCLICIPKVMNASQQKQRFIEQDVQQEIWERFQNDPSFVNMLPPDLILAGFFHGIRYSCYQWRFVNRLIKLRMPQQMRLIGNRYKLHKKSCESALKYFGLKCTFKSHARRHAQMNAKDQNLPDKPNAQPAIKMVEPSSSNTLRNEAAVGDASMDAANIQPSVVAAQAPRVDMGVVFAAGYFYEDSYDIDLNLGSAF